MNISEAIKSIDCSEKISSPFTINLSTEGIVLRILPVEGGARVEVESEGERLGSLLADIIIKLKHSKGIELQQQGSIVFTPPLDTSQVLFLLMDVQSCETHAIREAQSC